MDEQSFEVTIKRKSKKSPRARTRSSLFRWIADLVTAVRTLFL
jgi:hypothetical protein